MAAWWMTGVLYQIYPRSFSDSNGDGIGDIRGIIDRLDYLQWLGVDAIWLSPITVSPNADWGYDVADYCAVAPDLGTGAEFDELVAAAHERGIRVLLDFVPNHTSDQHEWFVDSRSSRTARYRDWYVWADPAPDGTPPNNWVSSFGGPAWTLDDATGQYYLHNHLREQPDLNWWNDEVRDAFVAVDRAAQAAFRPHGRGKWLADLFLLARQRLASAGLGNIYGGGQCTYSDPARFFSHRRDKVSGRMAALIWIED